MIASIEEDNLRKVADKIGNYGEAHDRGIFHIKIKDIMLENGALGSLMSGSGSTVFGLFEDEKDGIHLQEVKGDYG